MHQVGHGIGQRLEQGQRAGDRHAAGEQIRDAEGDGEVNGGERAGLRQAVGEGDAHRGFHE
jgi:hypothetical protein